MEKQFKDVFKVQKEISNAITELLEIKLFKPEIKKRLEIYRKF